MVVGGTFTAAGVAVFATNGAGVMGVSEAVTREASGPTTLLSIHGRVRVGGGLERR